MTTLRVARDALRRMADVPGAGALLRQGYRTHQARAIAHALADSTILHQFRDNGSLPMGYGIGLTDRCIELPWTLSRIKDGPGRLLDAGSALNHRHTLNYQSIKHKDLHIMTLAPETNCFWRRQISYLYGDLRAIPTQDSYYDIVSCVSVLEHVGCDNSEYAGPAHREDRPGDFVQVVRELRRVLAPGGVLLFTVPFGRYAHHGWFQQFDLPLLQCAINAFGARQSLEWAFYRSMADGWNVVNPSACADCCYDQEAFTATAVACVRLTKESAGA